MVHIELEPNLSSCIETLAKKEYKQTLNRILKEEVEDEELITRLEILRLFLELVDLSELRSRYEGFLMEGKRVKCLIYFVEGKVSFELIVR
jgi:predicted house-cleaning noncanonical NTP pyrophosphatase (MazG superfamily)